MATTRKGPSARSKQGELKKDKPVVKKRRSKRSKVVQDVIKKIEEKLDKNEIKPTVGDLVRLVQLEKELEAEEEQPQEIKVSWVERDEKDNASEK